MVAYPRARGTSRFGLVLMCVSIAVPACYQPPEAGEFLFDDTRTWDSAFAALSPEEQIEVYRYGITTFHPPALGLTKLLAREGPEVLPLVTREIAEAAAGSREFYLMELLNVLARMRCDRGVDLAEYPQAVRTAQSAANSVGRESRWFDEVQSEIARIKGGDC